MKHTFCSLFLLILCTCWLQAQTPVYVQVSTDGAYFGKMTMREMFVKSPPAMKNWLKICQQWQEDIARTLNETTKDPDWVFGNDKKAHYTATFVLDRMSRRGAIQGRVVLEYYSPGHHKLFYQTKFSSSGDNTQGFTRFTSRPWCMSARQVQQLMMKHLKIEKKTQAKRNYHSKLEKKLDKETTVFE